MYDSVVCRLIVAVVVEHSFVVVLLFRLDSVKVPVQNHKRKNAEIAMHPIIPFCRFWTSSGVEALKEIKIAKSQTASRSTVRQSEEIDTCKKTKNCKKAFGVGLFALVPFRKILAREEAVLDESCNRIYRVRCFGRPLESVYCVRSSQFVNSQSCVLCVEGRLEA
jgi:hypothetical protein